MTSLRFFSLLALPCLLSASPLAAQEKSPNPKGVEFFENKIRPVLSKHCYSCHSAQAKKVRGGLLLDSREGLRKGGDSGPALVPGKSKESLLVKALKHDGDTRMPSSAKKLDADVIADFVRWIDMGAPDPREGKIVAAKGIDVDKGRTFWAFQPLSSVPPPAVKNEAWVRTPVDRFILARLEANNLVPNQPASRERLIRRAYFDLHGLPPTPAEVEAFVNDSAPNAYGKLIDRLLESERVGERWGRHWLDLVRFAESGGYEFDGNRPNAYHYRDFVVKAFNQDMPFDQFVRWQIAGDHLEPNNVQAVAATGFLVSGPYPGQTTSKTLALIRYNHLDDMVSTLGSSMLGLSVGCARCHNHKYDPIPQEDYYRLIACLSRTDSDNAKVDPYPETYRKAKAAFDAVHNPLLVPRDKFEKEELPGRIKELAKMPVPTWITLKQKSVDRLQPDGKKPALENRAFRAFTHLKEIAGLRIEARTGKFLPIEVTIVAETDKKREAMKAKPVGKSTESVASASFQTDGFKGLDGGTPIKIVVTYQGSPDCDFTFSVTAPPRPATWDGPAVAQEEGEIRILLAQEKDMLTAKNKAGVLHWLRQKDPALDTVYRAVEEHVKKMPQQNFVTLFAAASNKGGDVNFLIRGEVEKKGPVMQPGFVQVLTNAADAERRWLPDAKKVPSPRIALAEWITDADHGAGHLLARVIVNRLWQHHMGRGLVGTPNDFGAQGDPPTHPELLDFLARELIRSGWKLKPIHKLIMTSAVYAEAGEANPVNMKTDPQNRLWWRRPARRLEAEAIRDSILAVAGTLDLKMYGPGTLDGNSPRRSVYLTVKRSQMVPLLQMFDVPEAMQSIGERSVTTVPTQSLAFMNSPFVRQAAAKLAGRVRPQSGEITKETIDQAYLTALSRRPTSMERERMEAFLRRQTESYGKTPQARDLALTDCCQVLLCLNEFIFVD